VLEMWIDVEREPVGLRLAGTLDRATERNVLSVVSDLIAEGARNFNLQSSQLLLGDSGGLEALVALDQLVHQSGGRLTGAVRGSAIPREADDLEGRKHRASDRHLGGALGSPAV
jgi:ABC-type transporter Mla MlaB component